MKWAETILTSNVDFRLETGAFFLNEVLPGVDTGTAMFLEIDCDKRTSLIDFCLCNLWGGSLGVPIECSDTGRLGSTVFVEISVKGLCVGNFLSEDPEWLGHCFAVLFKKKLNIHDSKCLLMYSCRHE